VLRYEREDQEKKEKAKNKKAAAKKKRAAARAKRPLLPHEKAKLDAKTRERAQLAQEKHTEELLMQVQNRDQERAELSQHIPVEVAEPVAEEAEEEAVRTEEEAGEDAEDSGVFDLELVARHLPDLPIGVVLDAEKRFIAADEDGSGVRAGSNAP